MTLYYMCLYICVNMSICVKCMCNVQVPRTYLIDSASEHGAPAPL